MKLRLGFSTFLLSIVVLLPVPTARGAVTLYVSSGSQTIDQVSSTGSVSTFATVPANSHPLGLAFDSSGNPYAADFSTDQISKITSGGAVSTFATLPGGSSPFGLAFDSSGNLYAADASTDQIIKVSSGGVVSLFATLPGSP